jgi:prophage antirepressor-like protein
MGYLLDEMFKKANVNVRTKVVDGVEMLNTEDVARVLGYVKYEDGKEVVDWPLFKKAYDEVVEERTRYQQEKPNRWNRRHNK